MGTGIQGKISEFYYNQYPNRTNLIVTRVEDFTSGWEAQLFRYVVEYQEKKQTVREERVIRLYHGNQAVEKATKEYNILNRLHSEGFPVPKVFHVESDIHALGGPFIIMELIKGRDLSEVLNEISSDESEKLILRFHKTWVDLHNLEVSKIFPETPKRDTVMYLDELFLMVNNLLDNLNVTWFQPVIDWLDSHRNSVTPEPLSVIHMDYHTRNVMVRDDGRLVVLDWTQAEPGDYRADLAWTVLLMSTYGSSSMRESFTVGYEKASGKEALDMKYFDVIAIFRRLLSMIISINMGAETLGMRSGAENIMKADSIHLSKVYELLKERTGIRLPEIEKTKESL